MIPGMSTARRATVYLDADLHRALRVKAAETDKSISDLVNAAVRLNLAEDAEDLAAYRTRAKEPNLDLEKVLRDLRRRGKL
jgi:plasmid stability protein